MRISWHSNRVEILAPAKLNLFLEVLGKRGDGYHEIDTIMCPIALCDRLTVERLTSTRDISLEVALPVGAIGSEAAWNIPVDDRNLIVLALKRLQGLLGSTHGCHVLLEKQIPAVAGLAGGSSDAAAAVCAGLLLWSHWDRELATSVCAGLGSDIPFFLGDRQGIGLARATGRGERIELLSMTPAIEFILTHPPVGCSTAEVYRRLELPRSPRSPTRMLDALATGEIQKIGNALFNALQFPEGEVTGWIDRQLTIYRNAGLEHCLMTGSGSCCFAVLGKDQAGNIAQAKEAATAAGINRLFQPTTHFGPSIESQI